MMVGTGILIFVVSFLFAMLGLGGGMLYVPIFHWLDFSLKNVVIPLALLLNGLNTLFALIPYGRRHLVDWKGGLPMALSALIGAPLGAVVAPFCQIVCCCSSLPCWWLWRACARCPSSKIRNLAKTLPLGDVCCGAA